MKLFKKLMSAMLAGVLAVGMLAGCSGGSVNGPVPTSPRPEDPAVQAVYEVIEQAVQAGGCFLCKTGVTARSRRSGYNGVRSYPE